ncbi:hypothetical protein A1OE_1280 [Candidatus Endolissoclinum faulkneri L2]|uniref:Uncharacterized protein n=1 Tax=Candidatus Endolissoclinum faulkneri L2 TaxID=1193729 RepID=K7Z5V2_9PROT|nr:hypothetical protein A1OE_1280 [Candidatus Endolissoclinum faulkneri L2]
MLFTTVENLTTLVDIQTIVNTIKLFNLTKNKEIYYYIKKFIIHRHILLHLIDIYNIKSGIINS